MIRLPSSLIAIKRKPPVLEVVGEFINHIALNDSFNPLEPYFFRDRNTVPEHSLKAPRPYFYESGIYLPSAMMSS